MAQEREVQERGLWDIGSGCECVRVAMRSAVGRCEGVWMWVGAGIGGIVVRSSCTLSAVASSYEGSH